MKVDFVACDSLGSFNSSQQSHKLPLFETDSASASGSIINANVINGNLHLESEDLFLSGLGLGTHLKRYYNSQAKDNPWNVCATPRLIMDGDGLPKIVHADGTIISFKNEGENRFISFCGEKGEMRLENQGDCWCLTSPLTGEAYTFDSSGRISFETDQQGGRLDYIYLPEKMLIQNASGQRAEVFYKNPEDQNKLVDRIEVNGKVYVQYQYDHLERLTQVKFQGAYRVSYEYEGESSRIETISEDDGQEVSVSYEAEKIKKICHGAKQLDFTYELNKTTVTHDAEGSYKFTHDFERLRRFAHADAQGIERIYHNYEYDNDFGYLSREEGNEGSSCVREYDKIHGWLKKKNNKN